MASNAIRLRTKDQDAQGRYRYLQALNGGDFGLVAARVAAPMQWETFLFEDPISFPLSSGSQLSMDVCSIRWGKSNKLARVQHGVRTTPPRNRKDPPLVTFEVGGPGQAIWVTTGFAAGYPGYPGDSEAERIFDIVKPGGGTINEGDEVSLRINSNLGSTFYFRVGGAQDQAPLFGDGTTPFLPDTTFVVEFTTVHEDFGTCGGVTGTVTRASGGQPIPSAMLNALNVPGGLSYTAVADANGLYTLSSSAMGACMPVGLIKIQASADRFETKTVDGVNVTEGSSVVQNIQLNCTLVRIKVVDSSGQPIIGQGVWLIDSTGNPIRDLNGNPYDTNTGFDGIATFSCVPHRAVIVETDADPTVHTTLNVPPPGIDATIVVQNTCGNIVGRVVTDPVTGTGIPNASVRILGTSTSTTTDTNGNFRIQCVRPAGPVVVRAADPSCGSNSAMVNVPVSGDSQPVVISLNCSAMVVDSIVIILQWGTEPADLDAHLSGPDGAGGRFHVFFVNRGNPPVPYASLDRDDRDGQGPEVLSITKSGASFVAGDYHMWVHNYIGSSFAGSNAVVQVLRVNPQSIPSLLTRQEVVGANGNQDDDIWHVLNLAVSAAGGVTLTVVQTLQPGNSNTMP